MVHLELEFKQSDHGYSDLELEVYTQDEKEPLDVEECSSGKEDAQDKL